MNHVDKYRFNHSQAPLCSLESGPLTGLRHRTVIDGRTGAAALTLWQEEHEPGFLVPLHSHDCEEIIAVTVGEIEASIGTLSFSVGANQSFLIPAGELHGFRVVGERPVRLLALFASPRPKIFKADGTESVPPWEGGASDHLDS